MDTFLQFKTWIEQYSGLERDALHIHGALFLYILAMVLFRQSRRSRFPWLFVLGLELMNEAADLYQQASTGEPPRWGASLKDLWNTMLWPTVLLLIGRYTNLFQHRTRDAHRAKVDEPDR
ncbi:MAG TPA: hypothetical protein VGD10_01890 [Allosphingosinicella sp.]|uniref:hypothetical protein n=1 Tax=Allosphingosinicella sp. TaxID=2823234 RepID=UPI002EDB10D0